MRNEQHLNAHLTMNTFREVVVVRLPRPMERKGATPIFSSLQKLTVPPQAAGVVGNT